MDLGMGNKDENLLYEMYDAEMSSAASAPLIPVPQGRGASFKLSRAMRHGGRWLEATWEDMKAESACLDAYSGAFQHSWGAVRVRYDKEASPGREVVYDRVRFDSLLVSQTESAYGPVQTKRLLTKMPPGMVSALYDIEEGKTEVEGKQVPADGIITESWQLPRGKRPGRYMLVAGSGQNVLVLADAPWTEDWDPIVVFHWRRLRMGFYDVGAVEQIMPYHNDLLDLNQRIRTALRICTAPRLLAHVSAQLQTSNLDSEAGRVYTYKGTAPTPFVWPVNIQEMFAERERVKNRAYEALGMSQMTNTQALPNNFRADSSAAVREVKMMEDQRHLDRWARFQDFRMELALRTLQVQGKYGKDTDIRFLAGKSARWDKAKPLLDRGMHQMWSLKPVSATSRSVAADRAAVEEGVQSGVLSELDRKYMAGHPDSQVIMDRARARVDDIDRVVELLQDGEYEAPSESQDLEYGQYAVNAALLDLRGSQEWRDKDSEALQIEIHMVTWIAQAQNILKAEADTQAQEQQAMMAQMAAAQAPAQGPQTGGQPASPNQGAQAPGVTVR
jgi:hypothetical protein